MTYDQWKTTDPRENEHQEEEQLTELDHAYIRIQELEKQLRGVAQQTWKPRETAPKDGQTFYAMTWHGSFDGSLHWALYWNGEHFESVNNGTEYVEQFTHWIVPDVSALPSAFSSTESGGK